MARVTITFEDAPDGKLKVVADPSFETMMRMHMSGHEWTSAHGAALFALNAVRKESRTWGPTNIIIPRIIRN